MAKLFSKVTIILQSYQQCMTLLHIFIRTWYCQSYFNHSRGGVVRFHCGFLYKSLIIINIEHPFLFLFVVHIFTSVTGLFKFLPF